MTQIEKQKSLRRFKLLATSLFLLMAVIFIALSYIQKNQTHLWQEWMGYVRAFAEAAMVGALADWFAVTALFNYPLGIKIPHTNLIENSKQRIGDNLGNFVVDNFLTAGNLKPYAKNLKITGFAAKWLQKPANRNTVVTEVAQFLKNLLSKIDDATIEKLIAQKGGELLQNLKITDLLTKGLNYIVERGAHQKVIDLLTEKLRAFIINNEDMVRDRVKKESGMLIPGFVDNLIAKKITSALAKYFDEIEHDEAHPMRAEITKQLLALGEEFKKNAQWQNDLDELKNGLLSSQNTADYAKSIWQSIKQSILDALNSSNSGLHDYFEKSLHELSDTFVNDAAFVEKTDKWIRYNAFKAVIKNASKAGELISNTVGNWQGRDLSEKLELEVGKDLQFIRINGTIVGGLVGLIIYAIVHHLL